MSTPNISEIEPNQTQTRQIENADPENFTKREEDVWMNKFCTVKSLGQGLFDVALFSTNVSQLKHLLSGGNTNHQFYTLVLSFLWISLAIQVTCGASILYISLLSKIANPKTRQKAEYVNLAITFQIFFLSLINIFISAFSSDSQLQS